MPTPSIQTLVTDAQQVLNLDSISAVRSVVAVALANANTGTPLNPNLTTQQLWNEFYQVVNKPKSDIESIIANQLMKFLFAPPAPGGAGANGQVIFNDNGVLAGDPQFLWNKTTNLLTVTGATTITGDLTVATTSLKVTGGNASIGTATPNINSNRTTLTLNNAAWGGQLDINVGAVNHASFGTDNFSSGLSCRIQSADGIIMKTAGGILQEISAAGVFTFKDGAGGTRMTLNSTGLGLGNASPAAALDLTNTGVTAQREIRIENSTVRAFVGVEGTSGNKFVGSATNNAYFGTASTFGLEFATNNNVRMLIDTSGNVGVGVTPSAWGGVTAGTIQTFAGATLYSYGTDNFNLAQNAFYNTVGGASDKYIRNGSATKYYQANGDHQWLVAPSGTAGNAISFTNALTLDANSNLVLGSGAVATTATNGFLYVTSCAGTPTGTPTAKTGRVPIVVDTTNNKLYFYSGGSWVAAN